MLSPAVSAKASASYLTGAGAERCQTVVYHARRHDGRYREVAQWVIGYLSGRIEATSPDDHKPFHNPDFVMAEVVSFCRANPSLQLDDAANDFFYDPQSAPSPSR
jgi:hypothetical protein